jgi:glutamate synthase (NADPH) small chain
MGKDTGFLEYARELAPRRPVTQRVNDWFEIYLDFPEEKLRTQGARCMDCGVPFCQTGCPVNNLIPDWNDLVYHGRWKEAVRQLHATNNFPEFTGRICPAPCEASCVLGINQPAVTIKQIEKNIVERGFLKAGFIPSRQKFAPGKKWRSLVQGPRDWRRRSSCAARDTPCGLRKSGPHRRFAASMASRSSRWRSTSSIAAWNRCPLRA